MDTEWEKHVRSLIQSKVNALKAVNKMNLPKVVTISDDSFSGLGLKTSRDACKQLKHLREAHGDNLPYLIGLSQREAWFALFCASGYIALMMAEGAIGDNDYMRKLATAEGYGEAEGIAWALHQNLNGLEESQQQATFRDGTLFEERLSLSDILEGAAINWFAVAATSYRAGDVEGVFDWLNEAQDALSLANGNHMWDEGAKLERESAMEKSVNAVSAARTALAKAAAQARHTGNHASKILVFEWCDANMDRFSSMDDAAFDIAESFVPQKFRAVREWMTEWKKLRSASRP